jgi:hypothetical protein
MASRPHIVIRPTDHGCDLPRGPLHEPSNWCIRRSPAPVTMSVRLYQSVITSNTYNYMFAYIIFPEIFV